MDNIRDLISNRRETDKYSKATSEKGMWIGKFSDRINSQPSTTSKISYPRMAKMISHLSVQDCHYLWKRCDESNNFAAMFRWSIKAVNSQPTK